MRKSYLSYEPMTTLTQGQKKHYLGAPLGELSAKLTEGVVGIQRDRKVKLKK